MKAKFSLLACLVFGLSTIGVGFFLGGCSSSTGDSDSSGSLQVTMSVSPSSITVGETAVIEAVVSDGTDPLANRVVNFTASPAGGRSSADSNGLAYPKTYHGGCCEKSSHGHMCREDSHQRKGDRNHYNQRCAKGLKPSHDKQKYKDQNNAERYSQITKYFVGDMPFTVPFH